MLPERFRTYADKTGRITRLPVKLSKKVELSLWALELFEVGRVYSEPEVNDIIGEYIDDFALMRRMLVEAGKLQRDSYGREYTKVA
ncbi:MAG: DUF2087 domain-containing protein [Microbacteriaceae bacterium]|nr:DUF2087 domain-containing protein [Microbacteriaceae bacterium]